ncbi:MAG TPA: carbohydrate ABC transporter permease [Chloroflexi bacterium]|nr:carbohydrate ABC transporter permease [Chloroflexota bacterium]
MQSTATNFGSPRRTAGAAVGDFLRYRLGRWIVLLVTAVFAVIVVAPFAWTVSTSMRLPMESFSVPPQWIVLNPDWSNYARVFERIPFFQQILNSFIVTIAVVIGQLFTASLAGYAFARLEFPGRNLLFWLIMATMMIPLQATIIPVFVIISRMGLANTLWGLIIPALPTAFGTFLMRQYFLGVPKDFEEAAIIDGANQLQVFGRVYLPLVTPALAVLAMLVFNGTWNDFFRPLIFINDPYLFTIPLGLNDLKGYMATGSISVVLAGVTMSLIPVVIVYIFGQRYLIEGIMMGGVKG